MCNVHSHPVDREIYSRYVWDIFFICISLMNLVIIINPTIRFQEAPVARISTELWFPYMESITLEEGSFDGRIKDISGPTAQVLFLLASSLNFK